MQIRVSCSECLGDFELGASAPRLYSELADCGASEVVCPKGHRTVTILQAQKFEILFDVAVLAMQDGYYREAVTGFAAALERFYEFGSRVLCWHAGVKRECFEDSWKSVKSQSERQVGAFVFLYLREFGEGPPLLPNALVQLRNEVTHKGVLPHRERVLEYATAVYSDIRAILLRLVDSCPRALEVQTTRHLLDAVGAAKPELPRVFVAGPTFLMLHAPFILREHASFRERLDGFSTVGPVIYGGAGSARS